MQLFFYRDLKTLQAILERIARKSNGAACETYNYCKFCNEPNCFNRKSETPCADAFLKSGVPYVFVPNDSSSNGTRERAKKFVLKGLYIVNVRLRNSNSGKFDGREFSYISDFPLRRGDIVEVTTRSGTKEARINRTNVTAINLTCKAANLRRIERKIYGNSNLCPDAGTAFAPCSVELPRS